MGHFKAGKRTVIAEINITPLTDIFLVLLIIIIVVAPVMAKSNRTIRLPELTEGDDLQQKWLSVEVASDGALSVQGEKLTEDQLSKWMTDHAALAPSKTLVVRGDGTTKSHNVMRLIEAARVAGFEKVLIAGRSTGASAANAPATPPTASPKSP